MDPSRTTGTTVFPARGREPVAEVRDWEVLTRAGTVTHRARLLGFASSERLNHICSKSDSKNSHRVTPDDRRKKIQCSACRWFEVTLLELTDDGRNRWGGRYAVATVGRTTFEDEITRCNVQYTDSAREIIEMLMSHRDGRSFLPAPAQRVLAQAADRDPQIERAYLSVLQATAAVSRDDSSAA